MTSKSAKLFNWHDDRSVVQSVDVSPAGPLLAAGGLFDDAIRVWDLASGELLAECKGLLAKKKIDYLQRSTTVRFSPDGKRLYAHCAGTLFELEVGKWQAAKRKGAKDIAMLRPGPGNLVCLCGHKPEIWNAQTNKRQRVLKTPEQDGYPVEASDAAWFPDGRVAIAFATMVGVGIYDAKNGKLLRRMEDAPNRRQYRANWSVSVDPTGELVATTREDDHTARVWSVDDNSLVYELKGHASSNYDMNDFHALRCTFTADGGALVVNAGSKKGGAVTVHTLEARGAAVKPTTEDTEENRVEDLLAATVKALKKARGEPRAVAAAIGLYLEKGAALECSPMELWDYFAISSPGLPEQAGYTKKQIAEAEAQYEELSKKAFG